MTAFSIRRALFTDRFEVQNLYRQLSPYSPEALEASAEAAWSALTTDPKIHLLVAQGPPGSAGLKLLGTVTLVLLPNLTQGARPYGLIENVVTHTEGRKQGATPALMARAVALARESEAYKLMLLTGRRDEAVHRLSVRSGFQAGNKTASFLDLRS